MGLGPKLVPADERLLPTGLLAGPVGTPALGNTGAIVVGNGVNVETVPAWPFAGLIAQVPFIPTGDGSEGKGAECSLEWLSSAERSLVSDCLPSDWPDRHEKPGLLGFGTVPGFVIGTITRLPVFFGIGESGPTVRLAPFCSLIRCVATGPEVIGKNVDRRSKLNIRG